MVKKISKADKSKEVIVHLINKMFEFANLEVSYDDIVHRKDHWYSDWTMNENQYDEWISYGEKYLQQHLKMTKKRSQSQMAFLGLNFGLTVDNTNIERANKISDILGD
jgi:hypothetical protein